MSNWETTLQRSQAVLETGYPTEPKATAAMSLGLRHRYRILCCILVLAAISALLLEIFSGSRQSDLSIAIRHAGAGTRQPTAWEQYGWSIAAIAIALVLQGFLILLLLFERQQRALARQAVSHCLSEAKQTNLLISHGEMSAFIAHELKQPLSAILINAEAAEIILNNASPSITELQNIIADIKQDEMRAVDIINSVRNMARPPPSPFRKTDVNLCIRETFNLVSSRAAANDIALKWEFDENLPEIPANAIQIQQVLLNITVNALDAITAECCSRREIVARSARCGRNLIEVSIVNYGPKIAPHSLKKIFDEYYTTKADGTGLGLAISRKIILAHRGRIWAANHDDGGVGFHIHLPAIKT